MPETCPICQKILEVKAVASHVWTAHVIGHRCWCGLNIYAICNFFELGAAVFKQHCDSHGGYLAHYLACTLGVPDD
jgi:hypothetical protein